MQTKIFISDLKDGQTLDRNCFLLKEIKLQKSSNGSSYYAITLSDKSGEIRAKIWSDKIDIIKGLDKFESGDICRVSGVSQSYQGNLQLIISNMEKALETDYEMSDFLHTSKISKSELLDKLNTYISRIENKHLKKLITNIFEDAELKERFVTSPAAVTYHHAFIGGLIEHVVEMLDISEPYLKWYPEANSDIVWAGIIVHDIGKTEELEKVGASFTFSLRGKLVGHISEGVQIVYNHLPEDFPDLLWSQIQHIILSHHREVQYGAAMVPCTIEAAIVSICDMGSAFVRQYHQAIEESPASNKDFSEFKKTLNGAVYLGDKSLKEIAGEKMTDNEVLQIPLI